MCRVAFITWQDQSKNGINKILDETMTHMLDDKLLGLTAIKKNTMRYPSHGILKASFVACVADIHPGIVIRMAFPDLHSPHVKHYHFGVVTIVTMRLNAAGSETPAVIRVHWGDESFNDFCFFSSEDFSFDALLNYANDFAAFRNGSLKGVDALKWSLIRKLEDNVRAARPCSATFKFSSPTRTHPEIVMWHFARNSTKRLKLICKKQCSPQKRTKNHMKPQELIRRVASCADQQVQREWPRSPQLKAMDATISFLNQVAAYVTTMKTSQNHK
jgi:hypothetical protein